MKKLLFLCFILITGGLAAQTYESQINYITSTPYTQSYEGRTVQSDGNLYLFDSILGESTLTITRTICSSTGIITPAQPIFTYNNGDYWGNNQPVIYRSWNKYNSCYLYFMNSTHQFFLKIPDIATDDLPSMHVFPFVNSYAGEIYQLGENKIYQAVSTGSPDYFQQINCMNLSDNTQSIVIPPVGAGYSPRMVKLGDDFLLVYESGNPAESQYKLINLSGNVTDLVVIGNPPGNVSKICSYFPGIGGGIYSVYYADLQNTLTSSGYISLQGNQIDIVVLEAQNDVTHLPWHIQSMIIPLENQRFICTEWVQDSELNDYFMTYQFTNGEFVESDGFPNLHSAEYDNADQIFRLGERYIIGISYPENEQRRFACVDFERQTIRTTTFPIATGTQAWNYACIPGFNKIYFMSHTTMTIAIYSVVDVVSNSEDVITPASLNVSVNPNPFATQTTIKIGNVTESAPEISIYNLRGQKVILINDYQKSDSDILVNWDGCDSDGESLPSGLYLYEIKAGSRTVTGKLIRVK